MVKAASGSGRTAGRAIGNDQRGECHISGGVIDSPATSLAAIADLPSLHRWPGKACRCNICNQGTVGATKRAAQTEDGPAIGTPANTGCVGGGAKTSVSAVSAIGAECQVRAPEVTNIINRASTTSTPRAPGAFRKTDRTGTLSASSHIPCQHAVLKGKRAGIPKRSACHRLARRAKCRRTSACADRLVIRENAIGNDD